MTIRGKEDLIAMFESGEKIQARRKHFDIWHDLEAPIWDSAFEYRVKPEPHYRPYADAKECISDVRKHRGWVRAKEKNYHCLLINEITEKGVHAGNFNRQVSYKELLENAVWDDDGSPCGVVEVKVS